MLPLLSQQHKKQQKKLHRKGFCDRGKGVLALGDKSNKKASFVQLHRKVGAQQVNHHIQQANSLNPILCYLCDQKYLGTCVIFSQAFGEGSYLMS